MKARLIALEDRLRQTEEVLVVERLARQTAEAVQQTVGLRADGGTTASWCWCWWR